MARLAGAQDADGEESHGDDAEGDAGRRGAEGVDFRRRDRGREALQFHRQGVVLAHDLRRPGDLVPRQGEAEQSDADERRQDDRQDDVAQGLPRRRPEVARGLLEAAIKAVEDRKHHQEAEGQRPGEMGAEAGGEIAHRGLELVGEPRGRIVLDEIVEQAEFQRDAK